MSTRVVKVGMHFITYHSRCLYLSQVEASFWLDQLFQRDGPEIQASSVSGKLLILHPFELYSNLVSIYLIEEVNYLTNLLHIQFPTGEHK